MRKPLEGLALECIVMKHRSVGWTEFAMENMPTIKLDGVGLTLTEGGIVSRVLKAVKAIGDDTECRH